MGTRQISRVGEFDSDRVLLSCRGIAYGLAASGQTSDLDWTAPEDLYIWGGFLVLDGHAKGDTSSIMVVFPDDSTPNDYKFLRDWPIASDSEAQTPFAADFPAYINQGLRIRVRYTSVGGSNVTIKLALYAAVPRS